MKMPELLKILQVIAYIVAPAWNLIYAGDAYTSYAEEIKTICILPAPYAFSVWGPIYIGMFAYTVYDAWKQAPQTYERKVVTILLIVTAIADFGFAFAAKAQNYLWTTLLIIMHLIPLAFVNKLIRERIVKEGVETPLWVYPPVSMFFAWISVATVASTSQLLYEWGVRPSQVWSEIIAIVLITVLTLIAGIQAWLRDYAYTLVVVWAFTAIAVGQWSVLAVGISALLALVGLLALAGRQLTHASDIPASFHCAVRKFAMEYVSSITAAQGRLQLVHDALQVDLFCNETQSFEYAASKPIVHDIPNGIPVVYVDAQKGSDTTGSGAFDKPLQSVQKALEVSRTFKSGKKMIVLKAGTYYLQNTLQLDDRDSGLTIQNYFGDEVWISGGRVLEANWQPYAVKGDLNVWVTDVPQEIEDIQEAQCLNH